jgi:flagellar biosynthetic protein FliR
VKGVTLTYGAFLAFLLVLTRLTGALVLNPILGRKAVPAILKVGLALILSILIFPTLQSPTPSFPTPLSFMLALVREIVIGYALGLVMNLLIAALLVGGEIMDMEMGASVAKIYDPQSNVSMPLTGTALNVMLTLLFFSTNGHLTLIKLVAESFQMFPPGPMMIASEVGRYISQMLGDMLILALKIAMPVLTIELLSEAGLGVLMRIVPQINVFVVGIQIKLGIGMLVVILALPAFSRLLDAQLPSLFTQLGNGLKIMLSTG